MIMRVEMMGVKKRRMMMMIMVMKRMKARTKVNVRRVMDMIHRNMTARVVWL
jgi:hypothetical protein